MPEASREELNNLYMRGVNDGYNGAVVELQALIDMFDLFGEDGVKMYLVGLLEGQEDAAEDEE